MTRSYKKIPAFFAKKQEFSHQERISKFIESVWYLMEAMHDEEWFL